MSLFPEGALVLLVGPPASGKTTFARSLAAAEGLDDGAVLTADAYRTELLGDASDTTRDRTVFAALRRDLVARMAAGRTTVVDATNLFPARRRRHVAVARAAGRPVVAVRFDVPLPELLARNRNRDRQVPVPAVVGLARQMREACSAEALLADGVDVVVDAGALIASA